MFESLKRTAIPIADGQSSEDQPSEIARGAALLRALAAVDEREEIRGPDYLAEIFLAENRKGSLKDPAIKEWLIKYYLPFGTYAYSLARTAYFDHVVEQALRENIPQIVFLVAGYDSRPYRFSADIKETRIFELDDCTTQQRKKELLQQANIPIPEQLVYVPVGDNADAIKDLLVKAGFDCNKRSLFICEGITYYLSATEVDDILGFIKSNSPAGSTVCFDYNYLPSEIPEGGSPNELQEIMKPAGTAEASRFGIEEGRIGTFLATKELILLEHLRAEELEERYLTLSDGSSAGKIPAQHCIVQASVL